MRIVIALGGNALGIDPSVQRKNVKNAAKYLAKIISLGHDVVITHGNGPQVGLINMAFSVGHIYDKDVYEMGFAECGAMSQAYIGYHLTEALNNELKKNNINKQVTSLLTSVLVDKDDIAFKNPTKPIGPFYTKEESLLLPYPTKEDSGRGYRRVIASPKPVEIIEASEIKCLLEHHFPLICLGGGGIPVIKENDSYIGIDAVIDKDFASSTLASSIDADMLIILTAVENAKINFGKPNEQDIYQIDSSTLTKYLNNNEFRAGSMKPKVEACLNFVTADKQKKNRIAVITSIENAIDAILLKKGTIIKL